MGLPQTLIKLIKDTIGEPESGAEIGVFKGETSKALLEAFPKLFLHMVDPWREWGEGDSYRKHKRTGNLTQEEWDKVYRSAMHNVMFYGLKRFMIHKTTSEKAATGFEDQSLDMTFIDGDHTYEMVKQDIKLWPPKIRKGGLIIFHDYGGRYRGVSKAVNREFGQQNLILPGNRVCGVVLNG